MNLAASPARHAVSSFGLAALAVSAVLARSADDAACSSSAHAAVREITVVGSADYATVSTRVHELESRFADCALATSRTTLYVHLGGGVVGHATAIGDDNEAGDCAIRVIETMTVSSLDEMDVMIPIDLIATQTEIDPSRD